MSVGLAEAEFGYLRKLMQQHSSIVLEDGKEYLVESRLTPLAYKVGMESAQALVEHLRRENYGELHRRVLDAMMNNETWFFRDHVPFELLRHVILPEMMGSREETRTLNIWSGAASSGQEAYSIAMLLAEEFGGPPGWRINILGTDLSQAILERARNGRYSQLEINRGLPAKYMVKHFYREGGDWVVNPAIRSMVEFRQMNLVESWLDLPHFDIVFMRNVLIYFEMEMRKTILERLARTMMPDGYLLMGAAETTHGLSTAFQRVAWEKTAFYRRVM